MIPAIRPSDGEDVPFTNQKRVAFTTTLPIKPARRMPFAELKRAARARGPSHSNAGSAYTSLSPPGSLRAKEADGVWELQETVNREKNASKE